MIFMPEVALGLESTTEQLPTVSISVDAFMCTPRTKISAARRQPANVSRGLRGFIGFISKLHRFNASS
jgi:hypothetical protein